MPTNKSANTIFNGQPIRYGSIDTPPEQVRLWDMLNAAQKKNVENWLPSERQFRLENMFGDGKGWVLDMESAGRISGDSVVKSSATADLKKLLNAEIVRAMDGKMTMVMPNAAEPVAGRFALGTISVDEYAELMIKESGAVRDPPDDWHIAEKVHPAFADYLQSVGEVVLRDDGNGAVWLATDRAQQERVVREAWLVSCGANNPSGEAKASPLHGVIERIYPREKRVWEKGLANAWLVADSVRNKLATATQEVTSGSFSMRTIGGHLVMGMRECQSAMEKMVEVSPDQILTPVRLAMENIWEELQGALTALNDLPAPEKSVVTTLTTTFDAINFTIQALEKRDFDAKLSTLVTGLTKDEPTAGSPGLEA